MRLNDHGKLLLLLYIITMSAVLGILKVIDAETVKLVIVAVLGYTTGNGVLAKRGEDPSPVFKGRPKADQADL